MARKLDDGAHINLAELNAVIKGVTMAMKWAAKSIIIKTDSLAVYSWVVSILKKDKRIRESGLSEMLVKRRLSLLVETLEEYQVKWDVMLVPTAENKADALTRVSKQLLGEDGKAVVALERREDQGNSDFAKRIHDLHHYGIETTLYFARKVDPSICREDIESAVKNCQECNSIDPRPLRVEHGDLAIDEDWQRVAIDVTHYGQQKYLTLIECGASRFAVWRCTRGESEGEIVPLVRQIFSE